MNFQEDLMQIEKTPEEMKARWLTMCKNVDFEREKFILKKKREIEEAEKELPERIRENYEDFLQKAFYDMEPKFCRYVCTGEPKMILYYSGGFYSPEPFLANDLVDYRVFPEEEAPVGQHIFQVRKLNTEEYDPGYYEALAEQSAITQVIARLRELGYKLTYKREYHPLLNLLVYFEVGF